MKYLVHRETKEHCVYEGGEFGIYWRLVEADADGWITWKSGECPLPDGHKYNFATKECPSRAADDIYSHPETNIWESESAYCVTAYRPILETAEMAACKESLHVESVFDRLNHAVVAAQSIPAILAEINSLLPDGYHVTKRIEPTRE